MEEFGPKLTYIKGKKNIVADYLSRMRIDPKEFSLDAFAGDSEEFPENYPLSYMEIHHRQQEEKELQRKRKLKLEEFQPQEYRHSDKSFSLITHQDRIVLPKELQ